MKANKKQINQYKQKPAVITNAELEKLKKEAIERALDVIVAFPMLALRDEFGFGKKRLEKFHAKFFEIAEAYNAGLLSVEDIIATLEDETGMKFEDAKPDIK